jgi:predicted DNA binding protein
LAVSLIAELRLTDAQLVLRPSLQAAPGMTIEREWATAADRASDPVVFVWAWGGDFEGFEAAIPDDPTVREFERIDDEGDRRLYRVVVDRSVITNPEPIDRETDASRLSMETTADGAVLEVRLPDREALRTYIEMLREKGFTVDLLRAHSAGQEHERYGLSEKQAKALREARSAGYFRVPRETDLDELSDRLGVSEQAVSERIRRGLDSVLAETIASDTPGLASTPNRSSDAESAAPDNGD